jgi:hypothetical protein
MSRVKRVFHIAVNFVPLYRAYRNYQARVVLNAKIIYNRRRKNARLDWAREYLTRIYLEKHSLTFREWLRKVESHG